MGATPTLPDEVTTVREPTRGVDGLPLHPVPAWSAAFPWLVHGTTGARETDAGAPHGNGASARPADFGLFGSSPAGDVLDRWRRLRAGLGVPRAVHARQVHGAAVMEHMERTPGLFVADGRDGHVTGYPGILLTVSLADCVPISLVDPELRRVALLHAGWRGAVAGIVEAGLDALGVGIGRAHAHLGPAICGACYEVGPEVWDGLGLAVPDRPAPVDLRAVLARQLVDGGIDPGRITVSEYCTRHDDGFFSHRGGDDGRQVGVLGVRV